jgi:hypothetical protein
VRSDGQQIGIAIAKIVCINESAILAEFVMPGLFDVSKEIILVTGASQGLGRQFARVLSGTVPRLRLPRARPPN